MSGDVSRSPTRAAARWDRFGRHGLWAALSGSVLALCALLPAAAWPKVPCFFQRLLHRPCPFCGLTRAVRASAQGAWGEAWHGAPLGPVLFLLLAAFFLWHLAGWMGTPRPGGPSWGRQNVRWIMAATVLAVLANWLYRWLMGFDRF